MERTDILTVTEDNVRNLIKVGKMKMEKLPMGGSCRRIQFHCNFIVPPLNGWVCKGEHRGKVLRSIVCKSDSSELALKVKDAYKIIVGYAYSVLREALADNKDVDRVFPELKNGEYEKICMASPLLYPGYKRGKLEKPDKIGNPPSLFFDLKYVRSEKTKKVFSTPIYDCRGKTMRSDPDFSGIADKNFTFFGEISSMSIYISGEASLDVASLKFNTDSITILKIMPGLGSITQSSSTEYVQNKYSESIESEENLFKMDEIEEEKSKEEVKRKTLFDEGYQKPMEYQTPDNPYQPNPYQHQPNPYQGNFNDPMRYRQQNITYDQTNDFQDGPIRERSLNNIVSNQY